MQQKVADQQEALEIAMKLETAPVEDNSGIAQIQAQLVAMALQLRESRRGLVHTMSDRRSRQGTMSCGQKLPKYWCAKPVQLYCSIL